MACRANGHLTPEAIAMATMAAWDFCAVVGHYQYFTITYPNIMNSNRAISPIIMQVIAIADKHMRLISFDFILENFVCVSEASESFAGKYCRSFYNRTGQHYPGFAM